MGLGGIGLGESRRGRGWDQGAAVSLFAAVFGLRFRQSEPHASSAMAVRARSPDDVHLARDHDKKACLRCKYIKLREKWRSRVVEGDEVMIIEQPDLEKPWGLGCVICSRYSASLKTAAKGTASSSGEAAASSKSGEAGASVWATFSVGRSGSAKSLGIEDILRHVGKASRSKSSCRFHAKALDHFKRAGAADPDTEPLAQPAVGQDERDDVPTLSQFRICYDVIKRVTPPLGQTYEAEVTRAREAGDATAAVRRGGEHTPPKIAQSVAAALFEQDRQLLLQGKIAAIGIAQDARKGLELTKVRFVTKNFDVHTRMIGLHAAPHKKAVEKVAHLEQMVDGFCGTPALRTLFADKVIVSTADGEAAEQLGLRLAKDRIFRNQAAVLRCGLHMAQRTLENAVSSDAHSKKLLHEFITKTSGADRSDIGSFARAVRNSDRLKADLGSSIAKAVKELAEFVKDALPPVAKIGASVMPSSAPQRFDSMLVCLQRFLWNAPGCLRFLCLEAASKSATSKWAEDMLHFLLHRDGVASPQNLLLLALLAEFVEVCSRFVRDQEAVKGSRFHIAKMAANLRGLEAELDDLFEIEKADGTPRLPRALSKSYLHGYVRIITESLNLETSSMLVAAGKVAWTNPGDKKSLQSWVLAELGSILNIKRMFLATLRSEIDHGVALALQPFDAKTWVTIVGGDLRKTLAPLATVLQVSLDELCAQFTSACPVALRLQQESDDIGKTWARVFSDAGRRVGKLGALKKVVLFMLAAFPGTGEVERNFSIVQGMSSHRRAGVSIEVLQACAKVALDGPKTSEFVPLRKHKCEATPLCKMAQNFYYKMYGGRRYQKDRGEGSWGTKRKGTAREGSMAQALKMRRAELSREAPDEAMDDAAVAAVKSSMAKRLSVEQQKHLDGRKKHADEKARKLADDAAPHSEERKKRLEKEERMAAVRTAIADSVQRKTLLEGPMLDVGAVLVVCPSDMKEARKSLRTVLGKGQVIKEPVKNIGAISAVSETKTIIWFVPRKDIGDVVGGRFASLADELKSMSLAVRILGGCIADEEWLKACKDMYGITGQVLQPMAHLEAAIKTPRELVIHESVGAEAAWATTVLKKAGDSMENPSSRWTFRPNRAGIKSEAQALVLFGEETAAAKDVDDKKT